MWEQQKSSRNDKGRDLSPTSLSWGEELSSTMEQPFACSRRLRGRSLQAAAAAAAARRNVDLGWDHLDEATDFK